MEPENKDIVEKIEWAKVGVVLSKFPSDLTAWYINNLYPCDCVAKLSTRKFMNPKRYCVEACHVMGKRFVCFLPGNQEWIFRTQRSYMLRQWPFSHTDHILGFLRLDL